MSDDLHIGSAVARTSQATLMDKDWCALTWGPWVPLERQAIMRIGAQLCLASTGSGAKVVLETASSISGKQAGRYGSACSRSPPTLTPSSCPFNDPHTAAPHLWLLRLRRWHPARMLLRDRLQATCRSFAAPRTCCSGGIGWRLAGPQLRRLCH